MSLAQFVSHFSVIGGLTSRRSVLVGDKQGISIVLSQSGLEQRCLTVQEIHQPSGAWFAPTNASIDPTFNTIGGVTSPSQVHRALIINYMQEACVLCTRLPWKLTFEYLGDAL